MVVWTGVGGVGLIGTGWNAFGKLWDGNSSFNKSSQGESLYFSFRVIVSYLVLFF